MKTKESIEVIVEELPEGFRVLPESEQGFVRCDLISQGHYLCGCNADIYRECSRVVYNKCKEVKQDEDK